MRERSVLLVIASTTGGTGRHVRVLVDHLAAGGARVSVCGPPQTQEQFDFAGAGATFLPIWSGRAAAWTTVRAVREQAADHDVVHAHSLRAGALAGLATGRRTPLVVTWHNAVLEDGPLRPAYAVLERFVARRANATLCVSPDLVDRVRALGGRDVRLAPVSAPPSAPPGRSRAEVRQELGAGDRPLVLTVGRLHEQKGYRYLIEAAARLAGRDPQPLFVAAGDGPLRDELAAEIDRRGAPVRLLGDRADIPDLLLAADLMVLPSLWEGSPLTVSECLRAGVPFVGTRAGGVPAMVGDAGLLVPPRDVGALSAAVARVLDEPGLAADLAGRALARAATLPTDDSVMAEVAATYERVLRGGRP